MHQWPIVPDHGTQYEENPASHNGGMHEDGYIMVFNVYPGFIIWYDGKLKKLLSRHTNECTYWHISAVRTCSCLLDKNTVN